jgi:hypothetical protein
VSESEGPFLVDGIQVHKVMTVSQRKSGNVWIYNTLCTGYTWSPLTLMSKWFLVVAFISS